MDAPVVIGMMVLLNNGLHGLRCQKFAQNIRQKAEFKPGTQHPLAVCSNNKSDLPEWMFSIQAGWLMLQRYWLTSARTPRAVRHPR